MADTEWNDSPLKTFVVPVDADYMTIDLLLEMITLGPGNLITLGPGDDTAFGGQLGAMVELTHVQHGQPLLVLSRHVTPTTSILALRWQGTGQW